MANLTVNSSTITVTDKTQNTVTVNFTCDKTLTDIKLSMDNGSTYKDKISMTQNSATFDITGMSNNNYTCYIKGYYEEISEGTSNYTVTNNLSNCINSNSATNVTSGNSYSATISPNSGYVMSSITVTMGGNNITNSVVSGNSIYISSVTGNIVITANATQQQTGGGSTPSNQNILSYMYPMPQSHECIPNGAPSDWKYQSRWENKDKPAGWSAFGGWAQVYRVEGTPFTQNTGVEIKNYKVYGWKNGQWHSVTELPYPSGNFYAEDFTDDANSSFSQGIKTSYDGSSVIIRLTSDMTVSTSQGTKNVCYHPFTSQLDYDPDFEYIFTCVGMRKVKWDENGVDDISTSKYCASCGGDWWRQKGLTWAPDWSNNKGIAQPKITEVTTEWKIFAMTTVPENWTNGFPV